MTIPATRLPSPPLVGRSDELSLLSAAIDRARSGRGRTVFVVGEGGVGKTRLITTAADHAAASGFTVAIGRGYPVETGVPYALFADALVPALRALDASTLATATRGISAELGRLFPALAPEHSAPRSDVGRGDPADAKARLFWSFSQLL